MTQIEEFKQRIFKRKDLNIETTPVCTLLCPQCKRTTFIELNDRVPSGTDLTPEQFKKVVNYFDQITFCGQLSDPIFNKHFLELLKMCADAKVSTRVLTAATGKSKEWYETAFKTNPQAKWTFGIDGPPKLSNRYRINQDGEFLFEIMLLAKSMNLKVYWQYIIFPWNESYIEECKEIARKHQISMEFIASERD